MEGQDGYQVEQTQDDESKCQSHRTTIDSSTACSLQQRSMMCGIPYVYMATAYENVEYTEYAENSSETSDTDEVEDLNSWNALLEALSMPCSSPAIQQSLQDLEVCRWHCRAPSRWASCTCPWEC